ncbi:MAG: DUF1501 domain-containing protein, partial [Actinomycetia bacterium]|nr:DUF1501 domain-containing protein [Actinomycetes bacterium]
FLGRAAGTGLGGALLAATPVLAQDLDDDDDVAETPSGIVIVLTLVGGLDGLSLLVPLENEAYYRLRPSTAIRPPGEAGGAIPYSDSWGLHPALAPLLNETAGAGLAVVGGVGLIAEQRNRSHRVALDNLYLRGEDRGWGTSLVDRNDLDSAAVWWFGPDRHRLFRRLEGGMGGRRPAATLAGYDSPGAAHRALSLAYRDGPMAVPARTALSASSRWSSAVWNETGTPAERGYPPGDLGDALAATADMVRADTGLKFVAVDHHGYDTHRGQGDGSGGVLAGRLDELARGLRSLWADLGPEADSVSVVAVSEFGRLVNENRRGGTNHGRGGVAMILDRSVISGVHGSFATTDFVPGAWPVTTDVHSVLAEVLARRGWDLEDDDLDGEGV